MARKPTGRARRRPSRTDEQRSKEGLLHQSPRRRFARIRRIGPDDDALAGPIFKSLGRRRAPARATDLGRAGAAPGPVFASPSAPRARAMPPARRRAVRTPPRASRAPRPRPLLGLARATRSRSDAIPREKSKTREKARAPTPRPSRALRSSHTPLLPPIPSIPSSSRSVSRRRRVPLPAGPVVPGRRLGADAPPPRTTTTTTPTRKTRPVIISAVVGADAAPWRPSSSAP